MADLRKVKINDQILEVPEGATLMQACETADIEIPRFCYHDRLSVAGNCRMCLVEVIGVPKPVASCAMNIRDLRPGRNGELPEIRTDTTTVKKAREGVMEFLLINHPLDCPICDQGGECDLQDQAAVYGRGISRYQENKRAVENKNMGPLIKTVMTRCIQCTRCVRFATEIAGVETLGMIGRGEDTEITPYIEQSLGSELSGNLIDLCPVGALTSKPYAFHGRPWELRKTESVDVMDAMGANVRIDSRGARVLRVLPRANDEINEEWISDKTRFACDGLAHKRLDQPYIRIEGKLKPASWEDALDCVAKRLKGSPETIAALAGDLACIESMQVLKDILDSLGIKSMDCRQEGAKLDVSSPQSWLFNSGFSGIDEADAVLIIGSNPRLEASVLNIRLRRGWIDRNLEIALIGEQEDLGYGYEYLGNSPKALQKFIKGRSEFLNTFKKAKRPLVILGMGALAREDGKAVLQSIYQLAEQSNLINPDAGWNGFNVLHMAAARPGGLALNFLPVQEGLDTGEILKATQSRDIQTLFLLGVDELDMRALGDAFIIYLGTHGDRGAHKADVILPGASYTEKDALWMNMEGRVQEGWRSGFPVGQAKEDWRILRALGDRLGINLHYNDLYELRDRIAKGNPLFSQIGVRPIFIEKMGVNKKDIITQHSDIPFKSPIKDFYLTNPIARSSTTMRSCSDYAKNPENITEPSILKIGQKA